MIRTLPKPQPRIVQKVHPRRLPERKLLSMTLVAGFRCRQGGVLLCSDREENDRYNKREVDKIHRIPVTQLRTCDVFIAGAGSGDLIRKFRSQLHDSLVSAATKGNVFEAHEALIQTELDNFYKQWGEDIEESGLVFIVVVAPFQMNLAPLLYRTNKTALVLFFEYCAIGTGQSVSDYFADRLFHYDRMERPLLAILAAFILREAQTSAYGVGLGGDMEFIHDGEDSLRHLYKDKVRELQDLVPPLEEAIYQCWEKRVNIPEWLLKF